MRGKTLDTFDTRILQLLQQDADMTDEAIADRVGLSASAVQRRVKRLEADGVIVGYVGVVDPAAVGKTTFFVVGLEVESEQPALIARLRQWLDQESQIQQVFYVTGTADYLLIVAARDVQAYDELMRRLMAENPNIRRFTTNVVMGVQKRSLAIPLNVTSDDE